jgi:hypothetical protein
MEDTGDKKNSASCGTNKDKAEEKLALEEKVYFAT